MRSYLRKTRFVPAALLVLLVATLQTFVIGQRPEVTDVSLPTQRLQRIGQMIERHISAKDISGAVTLVAHKGRIVHFEAHGLMDIESKKPMSKDALFQIYSMTKPITATAILMLIEEGRLRLTDPIANFVPEYDRLQVAVLKEPLATVTATTEFHTVTVARPITVRDLLTHTSGIVTDVGTISNREAAKIPRHPEETLADRIPRFAAVPLEFQPGTRWSYSPNVGFNVLARIVEVVSGLSFDRFVRERIFVPLGMNDTAYSLDDAQTRRVATNYLSTPGGLQVQQMVANGSFFAGSAGLMSSAPDYFRFAQMLLNRGQLDGKRLLSPRSVELMSSVYVPDTVPGVRRGEGWGLSVRVITDATARNTWLSNGTFGWQGAAGTTFWVAPREELVAILMVHTPVVGLRIDFENVVMQAITGV